MPDNRGDDAPEHLPGLEPDDPEYLPGLEPDEPDAVAEGAASATPPSAEATPAAEPGEAGPERYGEGEWTNAELDSWYEAYGGDAQYHEDINAGRIPRDIYKDIGERYEDMEDLDPNVEPGTQGVSVADALLSEAFLSGESRFSRLRPVTKAWLREHVEGRDAPPPGESDRLYEFGRTPEWKPIPDPADPAPGEPSEAGWDSPAELVYVTLPDGSEGTLEVDNEAGMQRFADGDGNVGE